MAERVPDLLVFVGTVHVVKQSANDVTQVIKVCACSLLNKLESCHSSCMLPRSPVDRTCSR
jgi:hypothetical protein